MPPSCRKKSRWNQHWNTLEKDKSLLKPDRCRHTAITKGSASSPAQIPRTTQPTIQNHLRRHLPSSTPTTLYSTLLHEPNSTHPILLNSTLPNNSRTKIQKINNSEIVLYTFQCSITKSVIWCTLRHLENILNFKPLTKNNVLIYLSDTCNDNSILGININYVKKK